MASNKMKNEKYHTVPTMPNINIKIVERGIFDIPNTQIHDRAFSLLGTVTSIKSGEVKLIMHDEPKLPCSWYKALNLSSLLNSPYFSFDIQKSLTQLAHPVP